MCRLIRIPLDDSPDFGGIRDAEEAVVEKWPSNQGVVLCMHTRGLTGEAPGVWDH